MPSLTTETLTTDVLVIGGGAAGLTAAIEARSKGAAVTILSKSKNGYSGNSIISGAYLSLLSSRHNRTDSHALFFKDIIKSGKEVNDPRQVARFVEDSAWVLEKLSGHGVAFSRADDRYLIKKIGGHSVGRTYPTDFSGYPYLTRGLSITAPLLNKAREAGVRIIDFSPVIGILVNDGRVCGAAAIDKKGDRILQIGCRSLILAAGGGGRIFLKSDNTRDITGDSYALAWEAGARIRDMEFVQFYPAMMSAPARLTISSALFSEGAALVNAHGEHFMHRYDRSNNLATRDIMSRAAYSEISEGRGKDGCIFVDCTKVSKQILERNFSDLCKRLINVGIDPLKNLIPVSPATHFFMGGVVVNSKGETTVPGLLACGEAVGGLHGANRLGGAALSETVVTGVTAGETAAGNSAGKTIIPSSPGFEIEPFRYGALSVGELKRSVRELMWNNLAIVRSGDSIKTARSGLEAIKLNLSQAAIENIQDLASFYELKNMLTVSILITEGADIRCESRGAHYRTDYPDTDDQAHRGNVYLDKRDRDTLSRYEPI